MKVIYFAGGCFWGTEHYMKQIDGVSETTVGYANGNIPDPAYEQVYTDQTGHVECVKVIYDDEFNKSAILDIEQSLIRMFSAEDSYELLNANSGQSSKHNYYQREKYLNKIEGSPQEKGIWSYLQELGLVKNDYSSIVNSDLFTYSPYTSLTVEQEAICYQVVSDLIEGLEEYIKFIDDLENNLSKLIGE